MIFVTVGTHEQQFDRLLKKVDELKGNGKILEDVFIQSGFSNYPLKNCGSSKLLSYSEMDEYIESANLVITHGGPASFLSVLAKGKPLIVVPRKIEFEEHVNNHQVDFLDNLNQRGFSIPYINDIDELDMIIDYPAQRSKFESNREVFNNHFKKIVQELVKG
ncbi:glycosyltransferase [Enterococcus avium]|uniref:glycosyltransferase n=1 Tax=Enterococcus avium TaxID=33945 RepID=UPI0028911CDD|nr:glycosyltransferase [Enterococcus avium]MDT2391062.1 glycosyltransferase [Enterococcus avium]